MHNWLVIKTRPRWEKKVAQQLTEKGIETFCPLVKQRRQWSDRVKIIDLPLLSSHLFVRIGDEQRTAVRLTEGVVNFVYSNGKPVVIKEKLIQHIRQFQQMHPQVVAVKTEGQHAECQPMAALPDVKNKRDSLWIETLNVLLIAQVLQPTVIEASTDKI